MCQCRLKSSAHIIIGKKICRKIIGPGLIHIFESLHVQAPLMSGPRRTGRGSSDPSSETFTEKIFQTLGSQMWQAEYEWFNLLQNQIVGPK